MMEHAEASGLQPFQAHSYAPIWRGICCLFFPSSPQGALALAKRLESKYWHLPMPVLGSTDARREEPAGAKTGGGNKRGREGRRETRVKLLPWTPRSFSQGTMVTRWTCCEAYFIFHIAPSCLLGTHLAVTQGIHTPDTRTLCVCACEHIVYTQAQTLHSDHEVCVAFKPVAQRKT